MNVAEKIDRMRIGCKIRDEADRCAIKSHYHLLLEMSKNSGVGRAGGWSRSPRE
jgi:hypothetical protein